MLKKIKRVKCENLTVNVRNNGVLEEHDVSAWPGRTSCYELVRDISERRNIKKETVLERNIMCRGIVKILARL